MLKHPLLLALGLIALGALTSTPQAPAAEAAGGRLETRLQREGYARVGEPRRKGEVLLLDARRAGAGWRLVVDGRTGEIIGQKPRRGE